MTKNHSKESNKGEESPELLASVHCEPSFKCAHRLTVLLPHCETLTVTTFVLQTWTLRLRWEKSFVSGLLVAEPGCKPGSVD